jgi:hypothetical protein
VHSACDVTLVFFRLVPAMSHSIGFMFAASPCWYALNAPHVCRQQPASGNQLAVHLDSGNPDFQRSTWQAAVYAAAGHDPFLLCDVAVAAAAAVTGGYLRQMLRCC